MIFFASDLHLSAATPGLARLFVDFLAGPARQAEALYLLGDIFEYWAGDDCLASPDDALVSATVAALREATAAGVDIAFLAGNRDFLIGDGFAAATGIRLLADPHVLSVPAWQFVLTHGDQLCTDDFAYQGFRHRVRSPEWRADFLAKPLAERRQIIAALRAESEAVKRDKAASAPDLMDVNAGATEDFLRDYGYATLIHGHTHRPARHDHIVDGIHCERWVLADWREDACGARGEVLAWDGEALARIALA
jgi:UDP-2,3-diacylglucosamine hydrolase